jgi:hypothetical protein
MSGLMGHVVFTSASEHDQHEYEIEILGRETKHHQPNQIAMA